MRLDHRCLNSARRTAAPSPGNAILVARVHLVEGNVTLDKSPLAVPLLKNIVVAAGRTDGGNAGAVRRSSARAHGEPVGMMLDARRAQELIRRVRNNVPKGPAVCRLFGLGVARR